MPSEGTTAQYGGEPSSDVKRLLSLLRRAEALERRLDRWSESYSRFLFDLQSFSQDLGASPRHPRYRDKSLQVFARVIDIRRSAGDALIRIDGGEWIRVPPSLAELAIILREDSGSRTDEMVPWKMLGDVIRRLGKDPSKRTDRHAITVRIGKLRKSLLRNGLDPDLVQRSRQDGVRFALLASPATTVVP